MPEPIEAPTEEITPVEEPKTPEPDMFGNTLDKVGNEISPEKVEEKKTEEQKTEEETKAKAEEIEKNPVVTELKGKLDEYSNNLKGQNDVIKKLESTIEELKKGNTKPEDVDVDVPFKEIKTSKDLTSEQKEDMTDAEIAQFDRSATLETAINGLFKAVTNQTKQTETIQEEVKVGNLNSSATSEASRLATEAIKTNSDLGTDVKDLANKIIVEFNEFNNEGITQDKLVDRMKKALNNVTGYKAPKELEKKPTGNKPVKDVAGGNTDKFGIDKIVEGVNTNNKGDYSL